MENIFANKKADGFEDEKDVLGGGGQVDTAIYTGTVKLAFAKKSQSSDAQGVEYHIDLKMPSGGSFTFRETQWVTNRNGEHTYQDKQDPTKKHLLPGYQMIEALCLLTTGVPLSDQNMAEKVFNLYDFEARKELPKSVPVLVDLIGKPITVAVVRQTVDQTTKDSNGVYQPNGKTRDENLADKFFQADTNLTTSEIRQGVESAIFAPAWETKNKGKTRMLAKGAEGNSGAPGAPPTSGGNSAPKTSGLFGKK